MERTSVTISMLEEDDEGWFEVVVVTHRENDLDPEGSTVGYVRIVEETEGGPHEWWDARTSDMDQARRFTGVEAALTALAVKEHWPQETKKALGWV